MFSVLIHQDDVENRCLDRSCSARESIVISVNDSEASAYDKFSFSNLGYDENNIGN